MATYTEAHLAATKARGADALAEMSGSPEPLSWCAGNESRQELKLWHQVMSQLTQSPGVKKMELEISFRMRRR